MDKDKDIKLKAKEKILNNNSVFSFETDQIKSYVYQDGQIKENQNDSDLKSQGKNDQFKKPLPNIPIQQNKTNNIPFNEGSKTPYNTPTDSNLTTPFSAIDLDKVKQGIKENIKTKKGSSSTSSLDIPKDEEEDPNKKVANDQHLKELHKNPNVGKEQYFTSFQKYVNNK
ncbi:hypothetical protein DLAC_10524 [Tieghemostelium lacteum]|uniref:Uncharacterized protein n=1 Tax=Tieghemostelium lacteum TaxID=361077 RepID=A0A151Z4S2_TIELA|nr:hypothetical protein DLAC_10524 [Tieghemostelium lacteum]|eukprot:KYQ88941.1 hypothetical protein DLAC_10524 [Tieghemostelium lacteum]